MFTVLYLINGKTKKYSIELLDGPNLYTVEEFEVWFIKHGQPIKLVIDYSTNID
jgi:hypothetical protein